MVKVDEMNSNVLMCISILLVSLQKPQIVNSEAESIQDVIFHYLTGGANVQRVVPSSLSTSANSPKLSVQRLENDGAEDVKQGCSCKPRAKLIRVVRTRPQMANDEEAVEDESTGSSDMIRLISMTGKSKARKPSRHVYKLASRYDN